MGITYKKAKTDMAQTPKISPQSEGRSKEYRFS